MPSDTQPEYLFAGVLMKRLLAGPDTGNSLCLFENTSQGKSVTPVHMHAREDETMYVIEGTMQVIVQGETRTVEAGQSAFLARNLPHQLMNVSTAPSRYLILCTPSGFEEFIAEGGEVRIGGANPHPPTVEEIARMKEAAPKYGITLFPGWPEASVKRPDLSIP